MYPSEPQQPQSRHNLRRLPPWLEKQDLTEADLPHIHSLMAAGFADWIEQADGLAWLPGPILLYHADGSRVAEHRGGHEIGTARHGGQTHHDLPRAVAAALESRQPALTHADNGEQASIHGWDCVAFPICARSTGVLCGALACLLPAGKAQAGDMKLLESAAFHYRSCLYRRFEYLFVGGMLQDEKLTRREENRRDVLFEVLRQLNDHLDVEQVLAELLGSLERMYPLCHIDLLLSQDYSSTNEKVRPLAFHQSDAELSRRAFLEGELREERLDGIHRLGIPLAGKQGVYGVLGMEQKEQEFDHFDIRFLSILAGAAGAAFEKAKLHEQANTLVGELRLINELTKRLNSSLKLSDTIQFASSELLHIFKADFCCILQVNPAKTEFIVMTSNSPQMIGEAFGVDYGFVGVMWQTKEPIILSDYSASTPVASRYMTVTQSRSLIASPLVLNGEVIGAVMISHGDPNYFSYDNYKLLQVLSAHVGLAVSNASLHAEVRRMVITDNLTGLFARHYLNERISRKQKRDGAGSLILLDVDHFKRINDTFGHQVGDEILRQVSEIIRRSIRDGDIAARWGGEELAIYLPQIGCEPTLSVAERIRWRVESETDPQVTVSCGISEWRSTDERISVESLFYRADMALYEAKHGGRNRIEVG